MWIASFDFLQSVQRGNGMKLANRVFNAKLALLLTTPMLLLGGTGTASAQPAAAKAALSVRHFYNVRFQRCLDADTNTGGNGGIVQLWDCGPWNQQWWR